MRTIAPVTAVLSMLLVAAPVTAQEPGAPGMGTMQGAPRPAIVATGQGEARTTPDRATIEVGVQTRAATAQAAGAANARTTQGVLDALKKLGIPAAQLSTVGYNLYPEMRYDQQGGTPQLVGYNATNTVRVEVRRLDQAGPVIDAALKAGANVVNGLTFYSSTADQARREALEKAVNAARMDAETAARAAGGTLGRLLLLMTIPESQPPRPMMRMAAEAATATPITPGEQTVTASVTARWEFVPGAK